MAIQPVETHLVYGFLDAGKTTYIQDCIFHDYFHKYGTTLILALESGEAEYDETALLDYKTHVAYWEGSGDDLAAFCLAQLDRYRPGRVYVEMNLMVPDLRAQLPPRLHVASAAALVDFATLGPYLNNLRPQFSEMVRNCQTVTFRNCPSREALAPYSQTFRLLNRKAAYLRQDAMGYHERAFDLFVPYDLTAGTLTIGRDAYLAFFLDGCEHPEHYGGKTLRFTLPLQVREGTAGLTVMTCCMADIQFMGFPLTGGGAEGWVSLTARGAVAAGDYGVRRLTLEVLTLQPAKPPRELILKAI